MMLEIDPEDEAFRQTVRAFCSANLPADVVARTRRGFHPPPKTDTQLWNRLLHEQGWSAPHWPVEHGGTGWSALRRYIFEEECYRAGAPELSWQGLRLVGPVLYKFGSAVQKARYLPGILCGGEYWVQGFSEPGSGSDLASLRTTAKRDSDHYVINGQKIWSSEAQYADLGFFLVRTSQGDRPQRGISFLLVEMNTPGIRVRPITLIDGGQEVNEIFFDDVRVPATNLVGEEGKGWSYAKFLLENERTSGSHIHSIKRELGALKEILVRAAAVGGALGNEAFARKLAHLEMDTLALEWSVLRVLANEKSRYDPLAVASGLKIRGAELYQRVTEMQIDAIGLRALRYIEHDEPAPTHGAAREFWPDYVFGRVAGYLFGRSISIAGGTNEIQKNIVAKVAFGL
jgi:alkylation response protein AidB-like acyl-CoA dehydrogenase